MSTENPLTRFLENKESLELTNLLHQQGVVSEYQHDAICHALIDIAESIQKAYGDIIPGILADPDADLESLRDQLFDLRVEFQHIDYHIHDAELPVWEWSHLDSEPETR